MESETIISPVSTDASAAIGRLVTAMERVIRGKRGQIELVITTLLAGGHILMEDNPGTGKTVLARTLAQCIAGGHGEEHVIFKRIQFTPDLLPMDLIGSHIFDDRTKEFVFKKGPLFCNVLLADEINRASPKVQSALLEAMAEHQITSGDATLPLEKMFFTIATQNPIEMEGTYPLPEAQLDRFLFNVLINYLPEADEIAVVQQTTSGAAAPIEPVFTGEDLRSFQALVRRVPIAEEVVRFAVRLAASSRPGSTGAPSFVADWINWGAGTRAAQALVIGAKARALWQGRSHANIDDVRALAGPVLRHRVLLNYRAEADGISIEQVIGKLLAAMSAV